MNSRRLIVLVVLLFGLSIANLFVGGSIARRQTDYRGLYSGGEYSVLLERLMEDIRKVYVDEVGGEELFRGAVRGMISALNDPNSVFFEPETFTRLREDTRGHYGGLGIVIGIRDGLLTAISVMEGKPAHKAGLKNGERIFSIDGISTVGIEPEKALERLRAGAEPSVIRELLGISLPEAVSKLRGPVGAPVVIKVGKSEEDARELRIIREKIDMETVVNAEILQGGIGYILLRNFGENTPSASMKPWRN